MEPEYRTTLMHIKLTLNPEWVQQAQLNTPYIENINLNLYPRPTTGVQLCCRSVSLRHQHHPGSTLRRSPFSRRRGHFFPAFPLAAADVAGDCGKVRPLPIWHRWRREATFYLTDDCHCGVGCSLQSKQSTWAPIRSSCCRCRARSRPLRTCFSGTQ